jgi:tRNA-dihydrouridine synthase B
MMDYTKCAGVMIGRGALSMPWIFRDTWSLVSTGVVPPAPTIEQKCRIMRDHFQNILRFEGERRAVFEFRKRVSWYAKQMTPCRILREGMRVIDSADDFERVMAEFLERRLEHDAYEAARGRVVGEGESADEVVEAA